MADMWQVCNEENSSREIIASCNPSLAKFNYDEAINALTLQFLNKNEATRVASLAWLTMLQSKAPRKVPP